MLDFIPILMEIYDMRNNVMFDFSTILMEAYVNLCKLYSKLNLNAGYSPLRIRFRLNRMRVKAPMSGVRREVDNISQCSETIPMLYTLWVLAGFTAPEPTSCTCYELC